MGFEEELNALNKQKEEKLQSTLDRIKQSIPTLILIAIAIFWIFYGTIEITPTKLSVTERVGLTICTIAIAVFYGGMIGNGGFDSAKRNIEYIKTNTEYEESVKRGNVSKKEIILYATDLAKQNVKENRKGNLESCGLRYNEFFDDKGNLINTSYNKNKYSRKNQTGYTFHQRRIIKKCIKTKVILPTIFGNISSRFFGIKREASLIRYRARTTITNTLVRSIISMFSIGFMFKFIGFSLGSMVYALFQIVIWSASGLSQRIKNYNFMIDVIVPQIKEKTLIITGYLDLPDDEKQKYINRVYESEVN